MSAFRFTDCRRLQDSEPRCATTGPCRVVAATPRCRSSLARSAARVYAGLDPASRRATTSRRADDDSRCCRSKSSNIELRRRSAFPMLIARPLCVEMRRCSVALLGPLCPASGWSAAVFYLSLVSRIRNSFKKSRHVWPGSESNIARLSRGWHRLSWSRCMAWGGHCGLE